MKRKHVSFSTTLSPKTKQDAYYAMPRVACALLYAPILIVQGIYAKHHGLSLTAIATVFLFARLFDAVTDPVIGYLSDQQRLRSGTRKPLMVLGACVMVGSAYFLYSPPDDVGLVYFATWFFAFYLGTTLFEVPHLAWGGEISHEASAKNQTYILRATANYSGQALFYSLPLLFLWQSTEITPQTLQFSAILSGVLMLPLLYFCMKKVPDGSCYSHPTAVGISEQKTLAQLKTTAKSVLHNKPFLLFLCAFIFSGVGLGMWFGLVFIFVDVYLGRGDLFAEISLITLFVSVAATLLWMRVAKSIGKKRAWMAAMGLGIVSFVYTGFLSPENVGYWALLILLIILYLCATCFESLPQSMLSDIVDYSTWKFGTYRGATYFSFFLFATKAALALGMGAGLAIAGIFGFDPSASQQSAAGVVGLKLAMAWIPTVFVLIAIVFIALSPITARRHRIIRRRLDALAARAERQRRPSQRRAFRAGQSLTPAA